ncbi:unnamed protein product [Closterium sp. Yama58-4]|nr:unnamed protein product [Closterium sp. Yama58-4]
MMGDNNPRITFGPSMASQTSPGLTRSLSSSDLSRRRKSDVPRHQSPQPKQRTPHYALPLNHGSSCSHRNSLGGTSGPLNDSATSSVSASGPIKSQKGAFTGPYRNGPAEGSAGGAGAKRKPHVRKDARAGAVNGVKSISALNDASKFTEEELAAFSAAGAAAESLLAEENGITVASETEVSVPTEEVVKEVTLEASETVVDASAAAAAAGEGPEGTARLEADCDAEQSKATGGDGEQRRRESKGSKGLFSRSFRASLRLLRRALPSNGLANGAGGNEGGELTGAEAGKKTGEQRRLELDDVNGNEGGRGKKNGGSESEVKGSQGAWMEVLRAPNSSSNSSAGHGGAGLRKDKENVHRLAV